MSVWSSIAGAGAFLGVSAGAVYAIALGGVVREALRPERRTLGWALGRGSPSDPAAWGLPAREWTHEHNGSACPVFDVGDDDPAAPTAIVLHGFARSRYDALARLGPILPHVKRVVMPDLPGHGDAIGRGTRIGADEDSFVESLIDATTSSRVLLVGHSLGATVALHAAARESLAQRVLGVVALAPYERMRTPLGARLDLRGMPRTPLLGPSISVLGLLGINERSTRESAARAVCPVAVLAGEEDPVTPHAEAESIARAARTSRYDVIRGARHDDFHTLGAAQLSEAVAWVATASRA
jgi:pimeloyl-ACP methyl ester carboxylesterase